MTFELYNERNSRDCKVTLTDANLVETLNVHGVGISLPQGMVKLNTTKYFTHMKFTYHGVVWIVKVLQRTNLGNDLYEVQYAVDYLKDYWNKYSSDVTHAVCSRSTVDSYINNMIPDSMRGSVANVSVTHTEGNALPCEAYLDCSVALVVRGSQGTDIYILRQADYDWLLPYILDDDDLSADWQKGVLDAFLIPNLALSSMNLPVVRTIDVLTTGGIKKFPEDEDIPTVGWSPRQFIPTTRNDSGYFTFNTGLSIPANNWVDIYATKYSLYIPMIGNVEVNPSVTHGAISVTYLLDMYSGTAQAMLNNDEGTKTATISLPHISLYTDSAPQAMTQLNNSQVVSVPTNIGAGVFSGAKLGGMAGGYGAVIGGIIGGVVGGVKAGWEYFSSAEALQMGSMSFSNSTGFYGTIHRTFRLTARKVNYQLSEGNQKSALGLPSGKYVAALSDLPTGYYWLDMSSALIYGGDQYSELVRRAYHNQRIFVP